MKYDCLLVWSWCVDSLVSVCRSFSLFWQLLKCLAEKLSCLHMQLVHSWQELIKDVQKYSDEQHKLHKTVSGHRSPPQCLYRELVARNTHKTVSDHRSPPQCLYRELVARNTHKTVSDHRSPPQCLYRELVARNTHKTVSGHRSPPQCLYRELVARNTHKTVSDHRSPPQCLYRELVARNTTADCSTNGWMGIGQRTE